MAFSYTLYQYFTEDGKLFGSSGLIFEREGKVVYQPKKMLLLNGFCFLPDSLGVLWFIQSSQLSKLGDQVS
jgi:hypothetical protein